MAVPVFSNLVTGLGEGYMQVSGRVCGVVPNKNTVGVRALHDSCFKVHKKWVCAVLKIEVYRKSSGCADLEQSRSTFHFWVWTWYCVTLS